MALPWAAVVLLRGDSCVQVVAGTSSRGVRSERKHPLEQAVNQKPPPLPSLDASSQHLQGRGVRHPQDPWAFLALTLALFSPRLVLGGAGLVPKGSRALPSPDTGSALS